MTEYSIQKLAKLAGVSVRTLHHYDHIGLLVPATRTEKGYRKYGRKELLRLQQIMFYRELDFNLTEIAEMLAGEGFDMHRALREHKVALLAKRDRIDVLLTTIDNTIKQLKGEKIMTDQELYEGFPEAAKYRDEAIEKFGEQAVNDSEKRLKQMTKEQLNKALENGTAILNRLRTMVNEDPGIAKVQKEIALHHAHIMLMWGKAPGETCVEAYKGLGYQYESDERYMAKDGIPQPEFAKFMRKAMSIFADSL